VKLATACGRLTPISITTTRTSATTGSVMSIERAREEKIRAEAEAGVSFYIAATGPETRVRRTLKHGDTFLVIDAHGDIGAAAGTSDGLFHRDTRFLSQLELRVNGMQPLLLGSNMREDNAIFTADLTNPDMFSMERVVVLEKDTLHINRSVFVWHDTLFQRLSLRNHGAKRVELLISIAFSADFADVFEVRGMRRARRGAFSTRLNGPHEALLSYLGLDDCRARSEVSGHAHRARNDVALHCGSVQSKGPAACAFCPQPALCASRAAAGGARRRGGSDIQSALRQDPAPFHG